jgi:hypothetical protein
MFVIKTSASVLSLVLGYAGSGKTKKAQQPLVNQNSAKQVEGPSPVTLTLPSSIGSMTHFVACPGNGITDDTEYLRSHLDRLSPGDTLAISKEQNLPSIFDTKYSLYLAALKVRPLNSPHK